MDTETAPFDCIVGWFSKTSLNFVFLSQKSTQIEKKNSCLLYYDRSAPVPIRFTSHLKKK